MSDKLTNKKLLQLLKGVVFPIEKELILTKEEEQRLYETMNKAQASRKKHLDTGTKT